MGRGLFGQLNRLVKDVTQRTSDVVARQEAAMVRGKVAGRAVLDDFGNIVVDAGHIIDDEAIERAAAAGKLHQLVVATGTARVQDLREAARDQIGKTGGGQEARAFDTIEENAEARRYVGQYAGIDVTDVRGNVIIPTGRKLTEEDVRAAREAGLLAALIYAAQQPYIPPAPAVPEAPAAVRPPFGDPEPTSTPVPPTASPRPRLSLVDPPPPLRRSVPLVTSEKDPESS